MGKLRTRGCQVQLVSTAGGGSRDARCAADDRADCAVCVEQTGRFAGPAIAAEFRSTLTATRTVDDSRSLLVIRYRRRKRPPIEPQATPLTFALSIRELQCPPQTHPPSLTLRCERRSRLQRNRLRMTLPAAGCPNIHLFSTFVQNTGLAPGARALQCSQHAYEDELLHQAARHYTENRPQSVVSARSLLLCGRGAAPGTRMRDGTRPASA